MIDGPEWLLVLCFCGFAVGAITALLKSIEEERPWRVLWFRLIVVALAVGAAWVLVAALMETKP